MSAEILKGAPVAAAIAEKTSRMVAELKSRGIAPCLALLRAGQSPDDLAYERGITKRCSAADIAVKTVELPQNVSHDAFITELCKLNSDPGVHGILVFLPLPAQIDEAKIRLCLAPEKDVDGITEGSMAGVFSGNGRGFPPCTAQAVIELLKYYGVRMEGRSAAVLGRSLVIGRPLSMLLMRENATVTLCHSRTAGLAEAAARADIIVSAMGAAKTVTKSFFRSGQTVIDVGINFTEDGKMCGDVDTDAASETVAAVTPVPGGVGAVTTAVLALHVAEAAAKITGDKTLKTCI